MNVSHVPVGRIAGLLLSCGVLTACYSYQPIEIAELTPELEVRTRVTGAEADRLRDVLGSDDRVVEGRIQQLQDSELFLLVPVVSALDRGRGGSLNQSVSIPFSSVVEVDVKQIDRTRTSIVFGVVTAAIGALVIRELTGGQSDRRDPDIDPPPEDRVIRIPISLRW